MYLKEIKKVKIQQKEFDKLRRDIKKLRKIINSKNTQDDVSPEDLKHTTCGGNDQMVINDFLIGGCDGR